MFFLFDSLGQKRKDQGKEVITLPVENNMHTQENSFQFFQTKPPQRNKKIGGNRSKGVLVLFDRVFALVGCTSHNNLLNCDAKQLSSLR